LFGIITTGAIIKNLGVENCNLNTGSHIGGLVGRSVGSNSIENCYVTGVIKSSSNNSGGLVGSIWKTVAHTVSNIEGYYEFKNLPAGTYRVLLDIPGLEMNDIHIIELRDGEEVGDINYIITEGGIETGIPELSGTILVYPNPTAGELRIENGELRIKSVEIFDVYGRIVGTYPCGRPETAIDISYLPTGIYFVKIRTEAGDVVRKVVKE